VFHNRCLGRGPNSRYLKALQQTARDAQFAKSMPHGLYAVYAGENEPVVRLNIFKSVVEVLVRPGRSNLDKRNFNDRGSQAPQVRRKAACLMTGAAD
jgi:hypothetical protein